MNNALLYALLFSVLCTFSEGAIAGQNQTCPLYRVVPKPKVCSLRSKEPVWAPPTCTLKYGQAGCIMTCFLLFYLPLLCISLIHHFPVED